MVKKSALELWSIFKERLSPTDMKALTSLLIDSNRKRIDKTQLIASALALFKNDEFLHRCFTDFLNGNNSQEEEEEDKDAALSEVEVESLKKFCKKISEELAGPSELLKLVSSIKDLGDKKIRLSQFCKSLPPLFKNNVQEDDTQQNVEDTGLELEEGEIRGDGPLLRDPNVEIRAKVGEKSKEDPKIGADAEIRVSLVKDVTHGLDKMDLEGKKRRILQPEPTDERSLKKPRTSRRLLERVTPSYMLIPDEEEQCPDSDDNVLNNKYSLMQFNGSSRRKMLSKYEEVMARCEEDMFECDMLMETLKSAVESAEKVIREKMSVEDLGVKFYRCIERLYRGDMFEVVREDHKRVLPVVLSRLKQKLDEITVAREIWIPMWKRVFEENTAKQRQRESTAQK